MNKPESDQSSLSSDHLSGVPSGPPPVWAHIFPTLLFFALAVGVTFPLWLDLNGKIQSLGDPLLNSYILAWGHYALTHQIADFFQANIFWPNADALAYGEHLIAQTLMTIPLRPFVSDAVALHNVSLFQAYFFCALSAYALGHFYFRSMSAATIAGLAYGFALYRFAQSGHIQLVHGEFLPLMILGFEKWMRSNNRLWLWLLGAAALMQWLVSWYWTVFTFWVFVPYGVVRLWHMRRLVTGSKIAGLLVAFAVAIAVVIPIARPTMGLKTKNAIARPEAVADSYSAEPLSFLTPTSRAVIDRFYRLPGSPESEELTLFPGFLPTLAFLVCLLLALLPKRRRPEWRASEEVGAEEGRREVLFPLRVWVGLTLMLLVFCMGTQLDAAKNFVNGQDVALPYAMVAKFFPFAEGIRVSARWMLPASLGLALLLAYLWNRWFGGEPTIGRAAMVSFLWAFAISECITMPVATVEIESERDAVFEFLAEQDFPSPVLEFPIADRDSNLAMLHATWHWQPMVNGSNGFYPPNQVGRMKVLAGFPGEDAVELLEELRVRYVVVDLDSEKLGPDAEVWMREAAQQLPDNTTFEQIEGSRYWLIELEQAEDSSN